MNIQKLLDIVTSKKEQEEHPRTFNDELIRQCNMIAIPVMFIAIFSWPIFIPLDMEMFGEIPIIIYLRWGFTLVGIFSLLAFLFVPFFKKRGHWLVHFIVYYLGAATAVIVGRVGGHPSYMGGFAIVILTMALAPMPRLHALIHLLFSLALFKVVIDSLGVGFAASMEMYGLFNMGLASGIAVVVIYIFDRLRKNSYENSLLLKIANEDLQKANELKNQLLQVAAHDLKDPLQVIIGYTDLLQMKLTANKFAIEKLRIIYRSTDRMIKLIAGLLEISNIESGKLVMHKTLVDFGEVVEATVKTIEPNSLKKNQKIDCAAEENCAIYGDSMLLRQVANHLIDNAVKFSPPGMSIWVTVEKYGNSIVFKVRDEGPGLDREELEKIFEKFQRLGPKPTGGEISTGLGLAITKDIVELHKGMIVVESEPGKGSLFIVELPLYKNRALNDFLSDT